MASNYRTGGNPRGNIRKLGIPCVEINKVAEAVRISSTRMKAHEIAMGDKYARRGPAAPIHFRFGAPALDLRLPFLHHDGRRAGRVEGIRALKTQPFQVKALQDYPSPLDSNRSRSKIPSRRCPASDPSAPSPRSARNLHVEDLLFHLRQSIKTGASDELYRT